MALPGFLSRFFGAANVNDAPGGSTWRPSEQITGVVCSRGASIGIERYGSSEHRLYFTLDTWRGADGITRPGHLVVRRTGTPRELRALMRRIEPYAVISARVRWTPYDRAELLELVDAAVAANDPLVQRSAQLRIPVMRHDEQFGTLTLHREPGWNRYFATVEWGDDTVSLETRVGDDEEPDLRSLGIARALWADQRGWDARVRDFIARELLDDKNENWLRDGEAPITADELKARVRLVMIQVNSHDGFHFHFNDDDLFWDHVIEVSGTLSDGPYEVTLQG